MDKSPNMPTRNSPPHPTLSREPTDSSATITQKTDSWPSKSTSQTSATSVASSTQASPLQSREPSPTGPAPRTTNSRSSSVNAAIRSRKNSVQDLSPTRSGNKNAPSPLPPTSKTLSSARVPALQPPATDPSSNVGVPIKSPTSMEHLRESPRWPISPRLRSPPPLLQKPNLAQSRRLDQQETPLIALQRPTPPQPQYPDSQQDTDNEDAVIPSGLRTPVRGSGGGVGGGGGSTSILETVQEVSPLGSPRALDDSLVEKLNGSIMSETSASDLVGLGLGMSSSSRANDSGSDSGSIKTARGSGSNTASAPPPLTSRQSSTSINRPGVTGKSKAGDLSLQSMTVETETVTSIPQAALAPNTGVQASNGSLRTKPSNETIRPKKKEKKSSRKQPTVTAANASSKADIFEAKVASAVEEANSSDSEETFVYDSNPPDARERPQRFHSRTPSATSMVSQIDRGGMRSIHAMMDTAGPPMMVKKSMKFVNTYNSNGNLQEFAGEDDGKGSSRSNAGSARGTARHHHHFGRWGRNGVGNGHPSLFAEQSPFSPSASGGHGTSRHSSSNPPSPRYSHRPGVNGKRGTHLAAGYDLDDTTTGADDERTPLIQSSTMRSSRSNRSRRGMHPHSLRAMEAQTYRSPPSVLNRFASCLVLTVMLLLVVSGAIGFMFATSQPLTDMTLVSMTHVVASQQELMLDLTISAHNPNVVVVVVDSADIEVFAKSPRALSDSEWWRHTHPGEIGPPPPKDVEDGDGFTALDDSPDDQPPDDSAPNMRLGTITGFNSALSFEGSFFHSGNSSSTGEVRLKNPGNGTYGGQERWERILEAEFQLILKGVLKYTLPLSQRVRTATISGKVVVKPNAANDPTLKPVPSVGGGDEVTISF
ncbi:vacuolar segregation protein 7 [Cladorrhinum samala]|uniref:Vacuolar segregation protein 7 n=1 Tax=Cladorrhinum samala TaxID=585594 RepID=A0AAV9HU70_9PEZI|nr:vacuolar segregation protein 7 [Cladorrhinum samala]